MADWTQNPLMLWQGSNGSTSALHKVSDHGRSSVRVGNERLGTDKRTANGTLRRFHVKSNRSWSLSWESLPSINGVGRFLKTVDGGMAGRQLEDFYHNNPGKFRMVMRAGGASGLAVPPGALAAGAKYEDDNFYGVDVMIMEFNYEVVKRGPVDLWNVDITLEEV